MNYSEQQQFFRRSRMWATAFVVLLIAIAGAYVTIAKTMTRSSAVAFVLTVLATCISMGYTPNYLHLTVNPQKKSRWQTKIRWRLAGLVAVTGLLLVPRGSADIVIIAAVVWLVGTNLLAKRIVPAQRFSSYFWAADFLLLATLVLTIRVDIVIGAALLAANAHLAVVVSEKNPLGWSAVVVALAVIPVLIAGLRQGFSLEFSLAGTGLIIVATLQTAWLVQRAQGHNKMNAEQAMRELQDFTGYPGERIWELWSTSNQQLAKNWELAAPGEDDREQLAQWYRDNSELYMFAISAYNLEYKRILSNLQMLRFGRGSCLDYGAGNGELILEFARQGHPATYYDVEGETLKFARQRARRRNLAVEFLHTKDHLARAARQQGFDTIFSFDVLEHLPDLPGELIFLSSLLNPGGLLVFDVPAGATKSHPMHLNHHLNIHAHMSGQGLIEEQPSWMPKLPFSKQEKYLFRAPTITKPK